MTLPKHKNRFVSRKLKKALKNHPCKKTKLGRYIIDILDSYYDYGEIGIGMYNGTPIYEHPHGYEHPLGDFYHHLIYDEDNRIWTYDELVAEKIYKMIDSDTDSDIDSSIDIFKDLVFDDFPF